MISKTNDIKTLYSDTLFTFFGKVKSIPSKEWGRSNSSLKSGSDQKSDWSFELGGLKKLNSDVLFNFFSQVKLAYLKGFNLGFRVKIGVVSKYGRIFELRNPPPPPPNHYHRWQSQSAKCVLLIFGNPFSYAFK